MRIRQDVAFEGMNMQLIATVVDACAVVEACSATLGYREISFHDYSIREERLQ